MEEWFKIKKYPHIGIPITKKDYPRLKNYITDEKKIIQHSFCPFIHRKKKTRKFRKEYNDGILDNNGLRKVASKERELYYATHIDSLIYSYYSHLLTINYNKVLDKNNISEVVTAYRKVPVDKANKEGKNKSNVDFANEVFSFIKENSKICSNQVAIAFDIKGFFDNLNHKNLKKKWCKILGKETLPKHHYQVFKNVTKFSYIDENILFNEFSDSVLVERYSNSYKVEKIIKKKKVDNRKYFKSQRVIAYCNKKEDLKGLRTKGFIKSNKTNEDMTSRIKGIPQGSPISSTLANIYMLDFDIKMNKELKNLKGIYRRYSDDMIVVCDEKYKEKIVELFQKEIIDKCKLEIQQRKTQIFHFTKSDNLLMCSQEFNTHLNSNRNLEYLGFQFDGENIYLKTSSIASYYRKMKRAIRRAKFYAKYTNDEKNKGKIFKNRLIKKYTYLGSERRRKRIRDKKDKSKFFVSDRYDWGNYLSYARMASHNMSDNKIKNQLNKHWKIFNSELKKLY